jgi:hypothetical protein
MTYCEAYEPPHIPSCTARAVHMIVFDPPTSQPWLTPRLVRYVCNRHADYYCNHGWGIPARESSQRR